MTNSGFIFLFLICLLILILIINVIPEEKYEKRIIRNNKELSDLARTFSFNHNRMDGFKDDDNVIFPTCITGNEKDCQWPLGIDVYDKKTGEMLLSKSNERKRIYPKSSRIPQNCGFGRLTFDPKESSSSPWACTCLAPEYFGGDFCDIPGPELTINRNCRQVAEFDNVENFDLSTFNPLTEGVCVECTNPAKMIPIVDDAIPSCIIEEEEELSAKETGKLKQLLPSSSSSSCYYDALNPENKRGSPLNSFVENYGCSCDYQNGYVEVVDYESPSFNSIACIKIGKKNDKEEFHRADIAFYCVQNSKKPIQVHSYVDLEYPFDKIFDKGKYQELLVVQTASDIVHTHDWLNRNLKPSRFQKIRRLNYPKDTWPVVDKHHLVNKYRRRKETYNLSTFNLSNGRGFETKHWYELTNKRWLSNALWGSPIVYSYDATDEIWKNKSTLNPLGVKHKWYYGITMKTRSGEIVRLDTRGYQQEKKNSQVYALTAPPHHVNEMMKPDMVWYEPLLYTNYKVENLQSR